MSRTQRALLAASLSAISLSTLTLPTTSFAAGTTTTAPTQYVVKNGDFLAGIAAKLHVPLADLLSVNHLTKTSLILPGDKLVVPAGAAAPTAATTAATGPVAGTIVYTVKNGDFLMGIATLYKVTLADLLAVNHLTIKSVINPGRQLVLPANAVAPQAAAPTTAIPAATGITYTVKFGDFLAGIAAQFKVKLSDLLAVNKITASTLILPGAKLSLPAGAVPPKVAMVSSPDVQATLGPAGTVVAFAYAQLGKPYRFFTAGPNTFDCSGLVKAAYAQIGIEMIHHAASQASYGKAVDIWSESIKPGDLVFMATHGTPEITHVGIAVDATHWIHAPAPGDVVRLAPIPPKGIITAVRRLIT
jgi:peptidoglycan DL-endopeptidase LytE